MSVYVILQSFSEFLLNKKDVLVQESRICPIIHKTLIPKRWKLVADEVELLNVSQIDIMVLSGMSKETHVFLFIQFPYKIFEWLYTIR